MQYFTGIDFGTGEDGIISLNLFDHAMWFFAEIDFRGNRVDLKTGGLQDFEMRAEFTHFGSTDDTRHDRYSSLNTVHRYGETGTVTLAEEDIC